MGIYIALVVGSHVDWFDIDGFWGWIYIPWDLSSQIRQYGTAMLHEGADPHSWTLSPQIEHNNVVLCNPFIWSMRLNLPLYVWMRPHGHRYTENPRVLGSYEGSLTGERVEYQTVPYVFYRSKSLVIC